MRVGTADTATEIRKEIISKREIFTRSVSLIVSEWDRASEEHSRERRISIPQTREANT